MNQSLTKYLFLFHFWQTLCNLFGKMFKTAQNIKLFLWVERITQNIYCTYLIPFRWTCNFTKYFLIFIASQLYESFTNTYLAKMQGYETKLWYKKIRNGITIHNWKTWQYRLWSFQAGGTKLERFLPYSKDIIEFWVLD